MPAHASFITPDPQDPASSILYVKAVPGASRSQITTVLDLPTGPRLKIRIAAAPESGSANKAIIKLLAKRLDLPTNSITLTTGHTNPLKAFHLQALAPQPTLERLNLPA